MTILPTVHLNGTGPSTLLADYSNARTLLEQALDVLAYVHHDRDYYPQGGVAQRKAREEQLLRCAAVRGVINDLHAMEAHVADARDRLNYTRNQVVRTT